MSSKKVKIRSVAQKKVKVRPRTGPKTVETTSNIVEEVYVPVEKPKKTSPYMSQFEYCALISARVAQLTSRSPEWNTPKIPIEDYDPLVIATKEVRQKLVSLVVRRKLPDGSYEDWPIKDMIFPRI